MEDDRGRARRAMVESDPLTQAIFAPLQELRDRYADIGVLVSQLSDNLDRLARGTHVPEPGRDQPPPTPPGQEPAGLHVEMNVRADDLERVLDFQERLSIIEGVTGVVVTGSDHHAARLLVSLGPEEPTTDDEDDPTIVCAWCDKTLHQGGAQISHGLCPDCAARIWRDNG